MTMTRQVYWFYQLALTALRRIATQHEEDLYFQTQHISPEYGYLYMFIKLIGSHYDKIYVVDNNLDLRSLHSEVNLNL